MSDVVYQICERQGGKHKNGVYPDNSWSRERYGDDPLTHPDFDPDLWMEVGSSSGPDKNRVYDLSNTKAENLWSARSVSAVGSSPSVSSTQSDEFVALKQQYERLSTYYDQLRQMVMEMRSRMGDDTWQPLVGRTVPGTTSLLLLLLLLQLRRCSSLILFLKHIKFVMNILMNII
jgi:hypothetical protein